MQPNSRSLALAQVVLAMAPLAWTTACSDHSVQILPLGDSITEGKARRPSYRGPLWATLQAHGCNVDFVGSQTGPALDRAYDDDHEGHWGWRTDEIALSLPNWLRFRAPDIALVHLGTNDVLQGIPTEQALRNLRTVVGQLRVANPSIHVLLARVIPARAENTDGIGALNAAIDALAAAEHRQTSPVTVVDQHRGYDPALNYDGLHPDERGASQIAQRWSEVLLPLLEDHCKSDAKR